MKTRSSTAPRAPSRSSLERSGSSGKGVADLQRSLRAAGFDPGPIDGAFGPKTKAAVLQFQRARNLTVDGVAGPQTWAALGGDRFEAATGGASGSPKGSPPAGTPPGAKTVTAYIQGRPVSISVVPVGNGQYMRPAAAAAFQSMVAAARPAGHDLFANSGFRTYAQQQALYDRYGPGRAARPGYSNHENGIAMDVGGVNSYGSSAYRWLSANAGRFGFVNDVPGEFWHFDYRG